MRPVRALFVFVAGGIGGALCDQIHVRCGTLSYPHPVLFGQAFWVPLVFGAGISLAGVAGGLLSMVYEISPGMGEPYTITALIVITLGGLGSAPGCLLGGFVLGLVETFGMHFTSPSLKMLLSYAVLIAVLLARPRGLFAR